MKKQLVYNVFFSLLVALLEGCTSVEIGDITDVKCSSFDQLSSVPPLIVDTMVKQDNTVEDVFDHLDDYIGVYYTSSELLTYKNAFL